MQSTVGIGENAWREIASRLIVRRFEKGEVVHRCDDVCGMLYFIDSGLARAYTIDENGKDYTWSIFFNDENAHPVNLFVVDYDSFVHQLPSRLEIEVLEDSRMLGLTYADFHLLNAHSSAMKDFTQRMTDAAYSYLHNLVIDRQTKSAAQRFAEFIEHTPHLLEKVPQYHIATYLSITPQHLSRLKRAYDEPM